MIIWLNSFTKRQTKESEFSYYNGDLQDIVSLVENNFHKHKPGYRDGVVLVPVEPKGFYSSLVTLKEGDKLIGEYKSRKEGETPRKSTYVIRQKAPAQAVDIVLYASKVLAEDGDNELEDKEGNWEIISINARPTKEEQPINPGVLMANHFGADGGTKTNLSDRDFVKMLREGWEYWKDKALAKEETNA